MAHIQPANKQHAFLYAELVVNNMVELDDLHNIVQHILYHLMVEYLELLMVNNGLLVHRLKKMEQFYKKINIVFKFFV